jgi:3-dehydroquinate dehydratase / shikimate dehydrogenase
LSILEVESAEQCTRPQLAKFRAALRAAGAVLLISSHDFTRTRRPEGLEQTAQRIAAYEPEFVKVVTTARSLADNLSVLHMIEDQSLSAQVVGIAMGEEGLISRSSARAPGPPLHSPPPPTALKQPPVKSPRAPCSTSIASTSSTRPRASSRVAGNPIAHSLSPLMHLTAFRRENVNAIMLPLKVRLSTTCSPSSAICPSTASPSPCRSSRRSCRTSPTWTRSPPASAPATPCAPAPTASSTASIPMSPASSVRSKSACASKERAFSSSARVALRVPPSSASSSRAEVYIVNRTHEKAVALARKAKAHVLGQNALAKQRFDAIVNTTPCGMTGIKQQLPIKESELNASLVFDLVYTPLETPLLNVVASSSAAARSLQHWPHPNRIGTKKVWQEAARRQPRSFFALGEAGYQAELLMPGVRFKFKPFYTL